MEYMMKSLASLTCALPLAATMAVTLLAAPMAEAGTVTFANGTTASGVTGLEVDGITYDVSFTGAPSSLDWTTMLPFTTESAALAAATALAAALQGAGATDAEGTSCCGGGTFTASFFQTFYGSTIDNTLLGAAVFSFGGGWTTALSSDYDISEDSFPFAVSWTPVAAAIPLPATLPLVLMALGGLGLVARRRRGEV